MASSAAGSPLRLFAPPKFGRATESRPECEKSFGREEKAEALGCDNYAGLLGTGRQVLLPPICVPPVPDLSPGSQQDSLLLAFCLVHNQAGRVDGVCDVDVSRVASTNVSSPPNHSFDAISSRGLTLLHSEFRLGDLPHMAASPPSACTHADASVRPPGALLRAKAARQLSDVLRFSPRGSS